MTNTTRLCYTAALLAAAGSIVGCRKTEIVGAAPQDRVITPDKVVTPAPTVIEHDRPVIIDHGGNSAYTERRPDGTTIEHHADGSTTERRSDGTVIERPR